MPIIPNLFVYLNTTSGSMPYECTVLKVISYYVSELSDMTSFTTYYLKVGTLVYRIDVRARLLILRKKSPLHGLI